MRMCNRVLLTHKVNLIFQSGDSVLEVRKGESEFKIKKADGSIRGSLALIEF